MILWAAVVEALMFWVGVGGAAFWALETRDAVRRRLRSDTTKAPPSVEGGASVLPWG
jgi:hypothetical protein